MFEKILENLCRAGNDKVANYADGDYYASFYGDESLPTLHCGVCNTPKEFYPFMPIIDINGIAPVDQREYIFVDEKGNPQKVPCLCKCRENSYKAELKRAELQKRIAENKLKCWGYMCNGAFIRNTEMEKVTFDKYEQNKFIDKAAGYYSSYADRVKEKKGLIFAEQQVQGKQLRQCAWQMLCLTVALMFGSCNNFKLRLCQKSRTKENLRIWAVVRCCSLMIITKNSLPITELLCFRICTN